MMLQRLNLAVPFGSQAALQATRTCPYGATPDANICSANTIETT